MKSGEKRPAIQASIWRIFIWKIREDYSLILSCAIASFKFRLLLLRNWGHSVLRVCLHSVRSLPVSSVYSTDKQQALTCEPEQSCFSLTAGCQTISDRKAQSFFQFLANTLCVCVCVCAPLLLATTRASTPFACKIYPRPNASTFNYPVFTGQLKKIKMWRIKIWLSLYLAWTPLRVQVTFLTYMLNMTNSHTCRQTV